MEAFADIIFAFRGSSEWFAQLGLEEILFSRPASQPYSKKAASPLHGIRLPSQIF